MDSYLTNELIAELEGLAIRTSQGSFVKVDDIRRLVEKKREAQAVTEAIPQPKTIDQARAMAKDYLREQNALVEGPREPGRSISATEPQPPSRA